MLHLRRKAEIQNLGNVDDDARGQARGFGFEFAIASKTLPTARTGNCVANLSQAALRLHAGPELATTCPDSSLEHIDVQLDARPRLSGLYVYVKAKLEELIRRLPLEQS
jgi:hypothetical protein